MKIEIRAIAERSRQLAISSIDVTVSILFILLILVKLHILDAGGMVYSSSKEVTYFNQAEHLALFLFGLTGRAAPVGEEHAGLFQILGSLLILMALCASFLRLISVTLLSYLAPPTKESILKKMLFMASFQALAWIAFQELILHTLTTSHSEFSRILVLGFAVAVFAQSINYSVEILIKRIIGLARKAASK